MMPKPRTKKNKLSQSCAIFDETAKIHWLRLIRTEGIGPITFYQLLRRFGSAEEAIKRLPEMTRSLGRSTSFYIPSLTEVIAEYEAYKKRGAHLIGKPDPLYPELLRHIPDAPPLISVLGDLSLLECPLIAIVGARNGSAVGKKLAETFAQKIGEAGFGIVSGLARGIDTHAHKGSLRTGTIAVLAGGIDHIYPPENTMLYQAIAKGGLLISETPIGRPPHATLFPRRNRLISGLSKGVLIVEAALKSGSLLTACYAAEQGRDIFAIPGNPMDPRSHGTNQLIKDGAFLAQTPEDIIDVYGRNNPSPLISQNNKKGDLRALPEKRTGNTSQNAFEDCRQLLLQNLSTTPISVDILAQQTGIPTALIRAVLVEIEIAGYLGRHSGDLVYLLPAALESSPLSSRRHI